MNFAADLNWLDKIEVSFNRQIYEIWLEWVSGYAFSPETGKAVSDIDQKTAYMNSDQLWWDELAAPANFYLFII